MVTETEQTMTDAQFMTKMQSLIPDDKWDDYVTEWDDAEYDGEESVDVVTVTDDYAVLIMPHGTEWGDYYDVGYDAKIVMERKAESITGDQFTNTYPVVLPVTKNE